MPKVNKTRKTRAHVFTWNNWTEASIAHLAKVAEKAVYLVYGKEVGEKGTPHLQGYIYYKSPKLSRVVHKKLGCCWTEPARGTSQQNTEYCTKDGDYKIFGKEPAQGERTDLSAFVETVKESDEKLGEEVLLCDHFALVARYPQFVDRVMRHYHPPESLDGLDNLWYYGPPGTGKTTAACALDEYYIKAPNKWFCGYADEPNVIVEDIEPKHAFSISWFLKIWGDIRPFTAQVKGSSMFIRPKRIIVTSNYSPAEMGWDEVTKKAIERRFCLKKFSKVF